MCNDGQTTDNFGNQAEFLQVGGGEVLQHVVLVDGFVATCAVTDDVGALASVKEFIKGHEDQLVVKAISMDGSVLPGSQLDTVASMPNRQEMLSQIVSIILGPGANLVAVFKGPASKVAGQIKALEEKVAKLETPVISNNSANRWTEDVPMIIPEINSDHAALIDAQRKRLGTTRGFIAVKPTSC